MKARWQNLTLPQRVLLLLQAFLFVLFLILYATIGRQQVISYQSTSFRRQTDGNTFIYSGKLKGEKAMFTVSPGPVVELRWGDTLYGPYTIIEDPSAVPDEQDSEYYPSRELLAGVEVWKGSDVLFRGAYLDTGNSFWLVSEDGTTEFSGVTVIGDANTKTEPSVRSILRIALDPEPVQRGHWGIFLLGVFICVVCTFSVLFADELFRFYMAFQIKYPKDAEPSDWELFSGWVGWIALTIIAFVLFILGLNLS